MSICSVANFGKTSAPAQGQDDGLAYPNIAWKATSRSHNGTTLWKLGDWRHGLRKRPLLARAPPGLPRSAGWEQRWQGELRRGMREVLSSGGKISARGEAATVVEIVENFREEIIVADVLVGGGEASRAQASAGGPTRIRARGSIRVAYRGRTSRGRGGRGT